MQKTIFMVNDAPWCIYEMDIAARNKEFLDGIDVGYFDYLIELHLRAEDEERAAMALRSSLHHSMETLFSLIGALVQAYDCSYAWIAKCSNPQLRNFVSTVGDSGNNLFSKWTIEKVSWESIADVVFRAYMPGTEKNKKTVELFASLWRKLASEFVNQHHINEYNSIKHGFRVKSGGVSVSFGLEHEYGVSPPKSEFKSLGGSEHGTSFFMIEKIVEKKESRCLRSRQTSVNWHIDRVVLLSRLVSNSINNIISALRVANGENPGNCKFLRPKDDEEFNRPWTYSTGVLNCTFNYEIKEEHIQDFTKNELLKKIDQIIESQRN